MMLDISIKNGFISLQLFQIILILVNTPLYSKSSRVYHALHPQVVFILGSCDVTWRSIHGSLVFYFTSLVFYFTISLMPMSYWVLSHSLNTFKFMDTSFTLLDLFSPYLLPFLMSSLPSFSFPFFNLVIVWFCFLRLFKNPKNCIVFCFYLLSFHSHGYLRCELGEP